MEKLKELLSSTPAFEIIRVCWSHYGDYRKHTVLHYLAIIPSKEFIDLANSNPDVKFLITNIRNYLDQGVSGHEIIPDKLYIRSSCDQIKPSLCKHKITKYNPNTIILETWEQSNSKSDLLEYDEKAPNVKILNDLPEIEGIKIIFRIGK